MTAIAHHPHPVTRAIGDVRDQLLEAAEIPLWSMDAQDTTTTTIADVQAVKAQLAALEAQLLSHAKQIDLPGDTAASSVANWHAVATRTTRVVAHRAVRLSDGLEHHDLTRQALAEGRVHVEQAEVILRALADLPDDLTPALVAKAEAHLLEQAGTFDAKALKILGRRILDVIDPECADAHEAMLLEKEERDAADATRLTVWDDGHGKTQGRFTIDSLSGAMLMKALLAFAAPKHRASQGPLGERKPTPERLGQAFVEMIRRYPTKRLPKAGGLNAIVVALLDHDTLLDGLKAAQLDTGEKISPGAARMLACEAGIIPAVLGGKPETLDLGRTKRLYSPAQRIKAMIDYQGKCAVEDCDRPGTHMHHPVRWADGGETNSDGIPLCPWHHTRAHDQRYHLTNLPTGKYGFTRRQ